MIQREFLLNKFINWLLILRLFFLNCDRSSFTPPSKMFRPKGNCKVYSAKIAREKYITYAKGKWTATNTVARFWASKMIFWCRVECRAHFRSHTLPYIDVWRFLVSFAKVQTASGYSFDEGWGQPADAIIYYLLIVTFRRDRNVLTKTCDDDDGASSFRVLISLGTRRDFADASL